MSELDDFPDDQLPSEGDTEEAIKKKLEKASPLLREVENELNKGMAVLKDVGAGAAFGATFGAAAGSWCPALAPLFAAYAGYVGGWVGAIYGVIDEFGGDVIHLFAPVDTTDCLDYFRNHGSCENIDTRMNNVTRAANALALDDDWAMRARPSEIVKRFDVNPAYAAAIIVLRRAYVVSKRNRQDDNERQLVVLLKNSPDTLIDQQTAFGPSGTPERISKMFDVSLANATAALAAAKEAKIAAAKAAAKPGQTLAKAAPKPVITVASNSAARLSAVQRALGVTSSAKPVINVGKPPPPPAATAIVNAAAAGDPSAQAAIADAIAGARSGDPIAMSIADILSDAQQLAIREKYTAIWMGRSRPVATGWEPCPGCG